jgi:hypothetical protein
VTNNNTSLRRRRRGALLLSFFFSVTGCLDGCRAGVGQRATLTGPEATAREPAGAQIAPGSAPVVGDQREKVRRNNSIEGLLPPQPVPRDQLNIDPVVPSAPGRPRLMPLSGIGISNGGRTKMRWQMSAAVDYILPSLMIGTVKGWSVWWRARRDR